MKPSEAIAISILESLLPGATARYRQDQSTSTHDIDLEYPDGRIVPVEVTTSVDEQWMRAIAAIDEQRFVDRVRCHKDWYVVPVFRQGLRIDRIRREVDGYLLQVESEGLERFFAPADAWRFPSVQRIWADLDIEAGYTLAWKPPGRIGIALPGQLARVDGMAVEHAVLEQAAKADNLDKLRAVEAPERHLFVYIKPDNFAVWLAVNEGHPPVGVPPLPAGITDVWAAAPARSQEECIVWKATSSSPWESAGVVTIGRPQCEIRGRGGNTEDRALAE